MIQSHSGFNKPRGEVQKWMVFTGREYAEANKIERWGQRQKNRSGLEQESTGQKGQPEVFTAYTIEGLR